MVVSIYFTTERDRAGYEKHRHDFAKLIWHLLRRNGTSMMQRSIAVPFTSDHVAIDP